MEPSRKINDTKSRSFVVRKWSNREDDLLAELWKTKSLGDCAEALNRSTGSVYNRVQKLGLKRTDEYKAIHGQGRFHKDQKPWNAGMKGYNPGGRTKETQFKRGHGSNTVRPIGSERLGKGGILYRKVSNTGVKKADWRPLHTYLWEQDNGQVPDGHIVMFKDKNRSNFDKENLILVSRRKNMMDNSIGRYGEEYRKTAITLGWFKRKINNIEQKGE